MDPLTPDEIHIIQLYYMPRKGEPKIFSEFKYDVSTFNIG